MDYIGPQLMRFRSTLAMGIVNLLHPIGQCSLVFSPLGDTGSFDAINVNASKPGYLMHRFFRIA